MHIALLQGFEDSLVLSLTVLFFIKNMSKLGKPKKHMADSLNWLYSTLSSLRTPFHKVTSSPRL